MNIRAPRILLAILAAAAITTTLHAQSDDTGSSFPDPYWPDLHQNNRAVGFGSVLMASGGYDVNAWKELRAFNWCDVIIGNPGDSDQVGKPIGRTLDERLAAAAGDDDNVSEFACWDVLATTTYQLVECPDGRAYIARSGFGVQLADRNNGELFAWDEISLCSDDGLGGSALSAKRPLDISKIRKTAK